MKAKVLLLSFSFAFLPAVYSFGQCTATSPDLVCQFPASGTTLATATYGNSTGTQVAIANATTAALSINAALAAQLTQLPVPSATVGQVTIRKKAGEVPGRWDNLGPILTDRPDTVGKGHVFGGFSYQHFTFNALDGFHLGSLPIAFTFTDPPTTDGQPTQNPKNHYGKMNNSVDFHLDQYVIIATAGLTRWTDLSFVFPINSVSMKVLSSGFTAYDYDINSRTYSVHIPNAPNKVTSTGSASGLGDISIGVKQMVVGQQHTRSAASVGAIFRFPSGDAYNYLGSGAFGGNAFGLVEYRARFTPHFKIAYQWNAESRVLGLAKGSSATAHLPGGLQYAIGSDFRAYPKLTLNVDFLGSQFINSPYFTKTTNFFNPAPGPGTGVPPTYDLVTTPNKSYTTVNFSGGVKWLPWRSLLLYGNALVQMNNVGLTSNISPLVGIAYNFNFSKND